MRRRLPVAVLACLLLAASGSAGVASPGRRAFQSVVFWLGWENGRLGKVPWTDVTQVNLFSLATCIGPRRPARDCTGPASLSTRFNGLGNERAFVRMVHRHGKLALISVGGSTNPNWHLPCQAANVRRFAQNLVGFMRRYGFDGIDLDIEQDAGTGRPALSTSEIRNCTSTVAALARSSRTGAGRLPILTSDVDPTTNFDIGRLQEPYVDQFNAMSYGATGATLASQVRTLERLSRIPPRKITVGVDVGDYPPPKSDCAGAAAYASAHHLAGDMLWFGQADAPAYRCLRALGR